MPLTSSPLTAALIKKSAQKRRKHCALAVVKVEPKLFTPPQTPFPGAQDIQNLISLVKIDAHNFRVIVVTDPQTNKHTDRGDYNTLHAA